MSSFCILVLSIAGVCALTSARFLSTKNERILDGVPIWIGEAPFLVSVQGWIGDNRIPIHICGGIIITKKVVISSTKCVLQVEKKNLTVAAGATKWYDPEQIFNVTELYHHEEYNKPKYANDITLIALNKEVIITGNTRLVKLPESDLVIPDGESLIIYGYGYETKYQVQKGSQKLFNHDKCVATYLRPGANIKITPEMLCAKEDKVAPASDDRGGPLVLGKGDEAVLVGVVSFGPNLGVSPFYPWVYVNVAKYRTWIDEKIKIVEGK